MSILIKGMEMPKSCYYCQFLWFKNPDEEGGEGMCDLLEKWVAEVCDRPDWCPLVEVPTPHGRLIEAERLMHKLIRYGGISSWSEEELYYTIKDMDIIIEAEE